ncbi:MAG: hypothetical protein JNJ54_06765 [Myxococcaceae bacterium]|nr:hypothetical protein [Myxococcaceae bacterium]
MTRVPPSRVPTRAPQQSAQQARVRRPQPRPQAQKEQKLKSGHGEDSLHSEQSHLDPQKAAAEETGSHSMEQLAHALAHAEQDGAKEAKEAHAETREQAEKEEKPSGFFARMFAPKQAQKQGKQPQQAQGKPQAQQQQPAKKGLRDGFEKSDPRLTALSSGSYASLNPVGARPVGTMAPVTAVQNRLAGQLARADRPPDAFSLLREAKEKGVLFQEDWEREGHSEDQDDPELAAAVEEVISRLFGKAGILRVGPGRNEQQEAVVVVVATQGFSEASLAAIPEKAGKFATMLALSFDLLPLRRER